MQSWAPVQHELTFPTGQAGLPTLRLVTEWSTPFDSQTTLWQADYHDTTYADHIGWQEVIVQAEAGAQLASSSVPATDVSQALRTYPDNLLQSPLTVNQASFQFAPIAGAAAEQAKTAAVAQSAPIGAGRPADPFAELISVTALTPLTILLALLAAFGWGAAHAFSPGHGKTIVGAYLVGSRGTVRHALFLGLTTTITHTAGVFALGFVTLFAAQFILPEKLYPWLSMLSGVLVVVIGAIMIKDRLHSFVSGQDHHHHHGHHHDPDHHHHDHSHADHEHGHDHSHNHHSHDHHGHHHLPPGTDGTPVTWRGLLALGISGGLLPCPSALVLMLGAISLQRVGFGLALIVMFSLGLASVLTAIGVVLVYAGKFFQRIPESGPLFRFVPVASALFITVVGVGITVQALMSIGVFTLS
ncbi:MAG: high-affinity nickel-transporter [Caldilinea sp. CFX5]|nr:high-affinity nickel-transporter [Caldilinea sp. CFX5]